MTALITWMLLLKSCWRLTVQRAFLPFILRVQQRMSNSRPNGRKLDKPSYWPSLSTQHSQGLLATVASPFCRAVFDSHWQSACRILLVKESIAAADSSFRQRVTRGKCTHSHNLPRFIANISRSDMARLCTIALRDRGGQYGSVFIGPSL